VSADGAHSDVADKQLDSPEAGPDADLYNAVLDACELNFRLPAQAQARSTAITTTDGVRFRLPVAGHPQSHTDYVIEVCAHVARGADEPTGYRIVDEPATLRHFTATFEPLG
jgi:tryptophanase